jgi:hypothetical protein
LSIIAAVKDDDVGQWSFRTFSANDRAVQREIRAAGGLSHIDNNAAAFAEALAREHANILLVAKELERQDKEPKQRGIN